MNEKNTEKIENSIQTEFEKIKMPEDAKQRVLNKLISGMTEEEKQKPTMTAASEQRRKIAVRGINPIVSVASVCLVCLMAWGVLMSLNDPIAGNDTSDGSELAASSESLPDVSFPSDLTYDINEYPIPAGIQLSYSRLCDHGNLTNESIRLKNDSLYYSSITVEYGEYQSDIYTYYRRSADGVESAEAKISCNEEYPNLTNIYQNGQTSNGMYFAEQLSSSDDTKACYRVAAIDNDLNVYDFTISCDNSPEFAAFHRKYPSFYAESISFSYDMQTLYLYMASSENTERHLFMQRCGEDPQEIDISALYDTNSEGIYKFSSDANENIYLTISNSRSATCDNYTIYCMDIKDNVGSFEKIYEAENVNNISSIVTDSGEFMFAIDEIDNSFKVYKANGANTEEVYAYKYEKDTDAESHFEYAEKYRFVTLLSEKYVLVQFGRTLEYSERVLQSYIIDMTAGDTNPLENNTAFPLFNEKGEYLEMNGSFFVDEKRKTYYSWFYSDDYNSSELIAIPFDDSQAPYVPPYLYDYISKDTIVTSSDTNDTHAEN